MGLGGRGLGRGEGRGTEGACWERKGDGRWGRWGERQKETAGYGPKSLGPF